MQSPITSEVLGPGNVRRIFFEIFHIVVMVAVCKRENGFICLPLRQHLLNLHCSVCGDLGLSFVVACEKMEFTKASGMCADLEKPRARVCLQRKIGHVYEEVGNNSVQDKSSAYKKDVNRHHLRVQQCCAGTRAVPPRVWRHRCITCRVGNFEHLQHRLSLQNGTHELVFHVGSISSAQAADEL
jgi:hypothetical protein